MLIFSPYPIEVVEIINLISIPYKVDGDYSLHHKPLPDPLYQLMIQIFPDHQIVPLCAVLYCYGRFAVKSMV